MMLSGWRLTLITSINYALKRYGKVRPRTGHEGPEEEQRYSSTLSLTLVLDGGRWLMPRPGHLTPSKKPGTHCRGGWVGPRAGVDGWGKSHPHLTWEEIWRGSTKKTVCTALKFACTSSNFMKSHLKNVAEEKEILFSNECTWSLQFCIPLCQMRAAAAAI